MRPTTSRAGLVVSAAALLLSAGAATAAPKPACEVVKDDKGDTFAVRAQDGAGAFGPQEDALDIVSADLGSDGKTLTAVLRVAKLALTTGTAPNGISFRMQFTHAGVAPDVNLYMDARASGGATVFSAGSRNVTANVSTKLGDVQGVFDVAKNEVRISAPLSLFKDVGGPIKAGTRLIFNELDQTSARVVAVNPVAGTATAAFADVTTSTAAYVVGDPTCVPVGK